MGLSVVTVRKWANASLCCRESRTKNRMRVIALQTERGGSYSNEQKSLELPSLRPGP